MSDFSDDADIKSEEMARMVEDLEELDNTLLGGSLKKPDLFSATSNDKDKEGTEGKKKVAFKDFNDDDPLADLLSDSDDSFETKKPILPNAKSNRVADLFGIKNSKPAEKNFEPAKLQNSTGLSKANVQTRSSSLLEENNSIVLMNKKPPVKTQPAARSAMHNQMENEEKFEEAAKLPSNKAKKSLLMEDLFGPRARSAPTTEFETRPNFSKSGSENPATLLEPRKSEPMVKSTGYTLEPSASREPRRGRRNSAVISDPLGLFAAPSKQSEEAADVASKTNVNHNVRHQTALPQDDLPEWLGGSAKPKETKIENDKQTEKTSEGLSTTISSTTNVSVPQETQASGSIGLLPTISQENSFIHPDMSILIGTQFDQQAAIISMQQQEHELKTAATLSHQNEQVTKIVENQKAKLNEQEKMFNVLIKRQIDRQSMLETQMKIQQARIDHYIQTLMAQPSTIPIGTFPEVKTTDDFNTENEKHETPESLVKKLQLENLYLENTLESLKDRHEKEIQILEESYEKQMLFLRQAMEKLETKLDKDTKALEIEYERKIEKLKEEKLQQEQGYQEEIEKLRKMEKHYVEEIYDRHSHNVDLLQKEHAETIDGISRAKELERLAIEAVTTHKTDLGNLLQRSQLVIDSFQNLQKKLEDKDEEFCESRAIYLKKQEENLQLLKDQLNLQKEALTDERKRLIEISQNLDTATVELTSEFKKSSTVINENEERLATRERALIREKELFNEQIKWERDHLQVMKEAWLKEQERQMKLLSEERAAAAVERAKLQVLNRLKSGSDDIAKVELETALKTAQEAANEANQEGHKWQERTKALEAQRRSVQDKEKQLMERAKQLDDLTQSALMKREEGFNALKEARRIEQQHKVHLRQLQMQLESLAQRENKMAIEKLALARERLSTKIYEAEKPEKDVGENNPRTHYENDRSIVSNSVVSTHFKDIVDPQLLLLKLNLDNKLDMSNELLSAMQLVSK